MKSLIYKSTGKMKKIICIAIIAFSVAKAGAQGTTWDLAGNASTTPGTHFVGTTDNKDIIFKRNSTFSGLIHTSNTSFGLSALSSLTTGYHNSAFGVTALVSNTTGYLNAAFGSAALYNNTTGVDNAAFGFEALRSNTTGSNNVATGLQALYSNTTGENNTSVGFQALFNNTTGANNTASGFRALMSNTSGDVNTAFGFLAMANNTTGAANTAIGLEALYSNTTGYLNTAIGLTSLFSNTTGDNNTANGMQALYSNTTGKYNTAEGVNSLYHNTTGQSNSSVGYYSLSSNTTGINNVGFGYNAGQAVTTGNNNTFLGYYTGQGITTGGQNTIVGANVAGLTANLSNTVTLADGAGNIRLYSDNAGHTGIGTNTPNENAKLDVNGNIYCNSKVYIGTPDNNTTDQISSYALAVNGTAMFNKAKVKLYGNWPDYVFEEKYSLLPIAELEQYIQKNKHLPNIPSASQIEKDGIDLGANQTILLQKIEELTLYIIDQHKRIERLEKQNSQIAEMQQQINELKKTAKENK